MNKCTFLSILLSTSFLLAVASLFGQTNYDTVITSGASVWRPRPGTKTFFVQLWGGGAGGNSSWAGGVFGYNGTGGGGGGTFSKSIVYTVSAIKSLSGYGYKVGTGGGINQDGTNSFFENCFAFEGLTIGKTRRKANITGEVFVSYFGGNGGQSWRNILNSQWHGGGGGSARVNGEAAGGQTAGDGFHGFGGDGSGGGGMTNSNLAGIPGGGGSGNQVGARGEIRIFATCDYTPGEIGNAHTIPFPSEMPTGTDFITNTQSPVGFGFTISWQRSIDQLTWSTIPGANQLTYAIPDTLSRTTYFRRVVNGCNPDPLANSSNVVRIRVFNPSASDPNDRAKNGRIRGRVVSVNGGTGIPGIEIRVQKTVNLLGSPQTYVYVRTTDGDGKYDFQNIFYGDASNGDGAPVSFTVGPVKEGHRFGGPGTNTSGVGTVGLEFNNPIVDVLNITDSSVYLISGRVTQTCLNCIVATPTTFGISGVRLDVAPFGLSPAFTDSLRVDSIGFYNMVVSNPGTYTLTPSYFGQKFLPASRTLSIFRDTIGVNFVDTSTRRISGRLLDGANQPIGTGNLLLEGVLKRKDSTDIKTFKLRAPVAPDGSYSIRVPASYQYQISVESFTPAFPIIDRADSIINFFTRWAPQPLIDVREKDSSRNLIYHRPPVIVIAGGLRDTTCNTDPSRNPGIVFRTNKRSFFQVNVFEGPPSLNQRIAVAPIGARADTLNDYLRIFTNVDKRKSVIAADTTYYRLRNASGSGVMLDSSLLPGAPETIFPFTKPFQLHYIDQFGRRATPLTPKSTVVGSFNPESTFTTASPEKVTLILHAPPGDASTSFWEESQTTTTTRSFQVGNGDGLGGFLNVSLGPTVGLQDPFGIGFDIEVIAKGSFTQNKTVTHSISDQFIESTKTNRRFEITQSPLFQEGVSRDLYIGNSMNFLMGDSKSVDFKPETAVGGCLLEYGTKPYLGTIGFATEFAYTEAQIVNIIIPQQQRLRDAAATEAERTKFENQISVWQQTIELNKVNKQRATTLKNISFSEGGSLIESATFLKSSSNTITYDVEVTKDFAAEFGFRAAGIGVSGGPLVSIRESWGNDTTTFKQAETTVGFTLKDDDPGDFYSVDVKKDPVYGTPVFDLVAGTSSCPPENGAQKRDLGQILSGDLRFENLVPGREHFFNLRLVNRSESDEVRPYMLSAGGGTGSGLIITSDGINIRGTALQVFIKPNSFLDVPIRIEKFNREDGVVSYPDVEFFLTDDCRLNNIPIPNDISTAKVSFHYANVCGNISLRVPQQGWVVTPLSNNLIPVTMAQYIRESVDSITLQYRERRNNAQWKRGFTVLQSELAIDSFTRNWNVASLVDTVYEVRLVLACRNGATIFSNSSFGVIDRRAPVLVGRPLPATGLFNPDADQISFSYNEDIRPDNLNSSAIQMVSFGNGVATAIPVNVTQLGSTITILPSQQLSTQADSFRVIARNITDMVGNTSSRADTIFFILNPLATVPYVGPNIATVSVSPDTILTNNAGRLQIRFRLRERAQRVTRVFFNLAGSALRNTDYRLSYDTIRQPKCVDSLCTRIVRYPVFNDFDRVPAYVNIDSNQQEVVIFLTPVRESFAIGERTVLVTLVPGSTYRTGTDSATATARILAAARPSVLFVNAQATGNNSGLSWQNAFTRLDNALRAVQPSITQIWVARGTYKPTTNTSRDSSFVMRNNLAIYGGFAGTETQLSQRNWVTNKTILSGDIGVLNNTTDNSYNVVRNDNNGLNNTAIMDGFTITGGNANSAAYVGSVGGAIFNRGGSAVYQNCMLIGNQARVYAGGFFSETGTPTLINCVLAGNVAWFGAGLYNERATTRIISCTLAGNQANGGGGGFYSFGPAAAFMVNSIVSNNSSGIGVSDLNSTAPVVQNSLIQGGFTGTGNLNADAAFIINPTPGLGNIGDLRLLACSPAVNTGRNVFVQASQISDLAGAPRIANSTIDMGAFERQNVTLPTTIYVDASATGLNDGSTWANAYTTLQAALNDLNNCATGLLPAIYISTGTYTAYANAAFNINKLNATIFGGYPPGGGTRNAIANPVIIKGDVRVLKSIRLDGVRLEKP